MKASTTAAAASLSSRLQKLVPSRKVKTTTNVNHFDAATLDRGWLNPREEEETSPISVQICIFQARSISTQEGMAKSTVENRIPDADLYHRGRELLEGLVS
ncbi:unnamed protein product [Linum trigynum]|uniref:Uncharacterized protein n=1 Tax=Linum trigynum TaxID=586398 RepID=A0AAV2E3S7_9ROSI